MPALANQFEMDRCPHCSVDKPSLNSIYEFETAAHDGDNKRYWIVYVCSRCGGAVTATSIGRDRWADEIYPNAEAVDEAVEEPARNYLEQAIESLHAPAGSIMLCASAVDAMLKTKEYVEGNLYSRIEQAAEDHLITQDMAAWAHQVRLEANAQRHADEGEELPSHEDARKTLDFAMALGEFLFVLPSRVESGLAQATGDESA